MTGARYIVGDSLTVLRTLPAGSVDLVVTSPPYLALRSYLAADDPNKAREMGSEGTPAAFIDALLDVTEELRRVLTPHGSICVELGDTYSGSGGAGGDYTPGGLREKQPDFVGSGKKGGGPGGKGWPLDKSLCMIPELYRIALTYGRNPLNGRECSTWRARNVIRHFRPNPPVGALGDKVRPATSDWVVACTSRTRYFDLDSVRTEPTAKPQRFLTHNYGSGGTPDSFDERPPVLEPGNRAHPVGAPPLDWWADDDLEWCDAAGFIAPTFGYPGSHYATFSPKVIKRLILPQCPQRVCVTCGEPSRRIVGEVEYLRNDSDRVPARLTMSDGQRPSPGVNQHIRNDGANTSVTRVAPTLGWTDCNHGDNWRAGVVLDPFGGSGVTGMVATGLGLDAILIDLDERNAHLAAERIGMFLQVEHHQLDIEASA